MISRRGAENAEKSFCVGASLRETFCILLATLALTSLLLVSESLL